MRMEFVHKKVKNIATLNLFPLHFSNGIEKKWHPDLGCHEVIVVWKYVFIPRP